MTMDVKNYKCLQLCCIKCKKERKNINFLEDPCGGGDFHHDHETYNSANHKMRPNLPTAISTAQEDPALRSRQVQNINITITRDSKMAITDQNPTPHEASSVPPNHGIVISLFSCIIQFCFHDIPLPK